MIGPGDVTVDFGEDFIVNGEAEAEIVLDTLFQKLLLRYLGDLKWVAYTQEAVTFGV